MIRSAARLAARWPVRLVTNGDQCRTVVERILSAGHKNVGLDCEGNRLGRFGKLSLIQLATEQEVYLFDVAMGGEPVMEPLKTLLSSQDVVKVMHDCREDASILANQHGVVLTPVFDTQVGHGVWLERRNLEPYQANIAEVLRTFFLSSYKRHRWSELEKKPIAPHHWMDRPLEPQVVRYAVEGVVHLLRLKHALCRSLGDPEGDLVLRRSVRYIEYAHLNRAELPTSDTSSLRQGSQIQAMLATRRPDAAYFKMNHGSLTGAVLDSKDLAEFADLQLGDIARCNIKSLSECRQFVHLQREGHGDLFFDRRTQEMKKLPSQEQVDAKQPSRGSSLYGFGKTRSNKAAISEDPVSYRERKPEMIYKKGKRGQVKILKSGFKLPQKASEDWPG